MCTVHITVHTYCYMQDGLNSGPPQTRTSSSSLTTRLASQQVVTLTEEPGSTSTDSELGLVAQTTSFTRSVQHRHQTVNVENHKPSTTLSMTAGSTNPQEEFLA